MGRTGRLGFVGVLVATLGLVACTGDGDSATPGGQLTRANGTPAVRSALGRAGTDLGDGFHVPNGAELVGEALPDQPVLSSGTPEIRAKRHWTAVLLVTGAADAVARDLAAQARAAGLDHRFGGVTCSTGVTTPGSPPPEPDRTRPHGIDCAVGFGSAERIALYEQSIRSVHAVVRQGDCSSEPCPEGRWPSLAVVTYTEVDDAAARASTPSGAAAGTLPVLERIRPVRPPFTLPRAGTKIRLNFDGTTTPVVPGSGALIPSTCNGCSSDVWIMRPEHPDQAFDAYARALDRLDMWESGPEQHREVRDGWSVRVWNGGNTDTGIDVELFERRGSPAYLRISLSNGA